MRTSLFYSVWKSRFWQMERGVENLRLYAEQLENLGLEGIAKRIRWELGQFETNATRCRQEWEDEIEPLIRKFESQEQK